MIRQRPRRMLFVVARRVLGLWLPVWLILILLRMTGAISWSWWLVMIPLWFAVAGVALAGVVIAATIAVARRPSLAMPLLRRWLTRRVGPDAAAMFLGEQVPRGQAAQRDDAGAATDPVDGDTVRLIRDERTGEYRRSR